MSGRLVLVYALLVLLISLSEGAEQASERFAEVKKLGESVREKVEADKLDEASVILGKAVEVYRKLPDDEKAKLDKAFRALLFQLAEKYRAMADQEGSGKSALKWYDIYSELQFEAEKLPHMAHLNPYFYYQQTHYSYVLGMAMAECGNDPAKVKKEYPNIAKSWAPFLIGDLDGDGKAEIISNNSAPYDFMVINVFSLRQDAAIQCFTFKYKNKLPYMSISDEDGDGKHEIILRNDPRSELITTRSGDGKPDFTREWFQVTITIKFDGERFSKPDRSFQKWDKEPKEFPK